VSGNVENKQAFLDALYSTNVQTPKGPIKLDANHDVVENAYVFQIVKSGEQYVQKLIDTVPDVGQYGSLGEARAARLGTLKGKWVGMTRENLGAALGAN
jgi:hypothetical protein